MKKAKDFEKLRKNEIESIKSFRSQLSELSAYISKAQRDSLTYTLKYINTEKDYSKLIDKLEATYGKDKMFNLDTGAVTKKTSN